MKRVVPILATLTLVLGSIVQAVASPVVIPTTISGGAGSNWYVSTYPRASNPARLMIQEAWIPGLEIEADDVKCTHASAIGKLDEEEIFYLMSRGIPYHTAVEMSVQGFFDPLMRRIPFEGIRTRIFGRIVEKINT